MFSDTGEIKTLSDFMYRLTNSDEVVKFLFLIHNRHSEVQQELLKHVTKDKTLMQCLEYAHSVEGNLQSVKLSKYIEKAQASTSTIDVYAVNKKKVKSKFDMLMSHQQGESLEVMMMMINLNVTSVD